VCYFFSHHVFLPFFHWCYSYCVGATFCLVWSLLLFLCCVTTFPICDVIVHWCCWSSRIGVIILLTLVLLFFLCCVIVLFPLCHYSFHINFDVFVTLVLSFFLHGPITLLALGYFSFHIVLMLFSHWWSCSFCVVLSPFPH
jgi:hypothetical protein